MIVGAISFYKRLQRKWDAVVISCFIYSALFAFLIHLQALVERCELIVKKAEFLWRRRLLSILDGASLSLHFVNAVDVARTDYKECLKISAFPFHKFWFTKSTIPATSSSEHYLPQTSNPTLNTSLTLQKINVFTADPPQNNPSPCLFPSPPSFPFPSLPSYNLQHTLRSPSFSPPPHPQTKSTDITIIPLKNPLPYVTRSPHMILEPDLLTLQYVKLQDVRMQQGRGV